MAGEIKLNDVSVATESGGTVTIAPNNVTFAANHAGIKAALNASGSAGVYACRAWVNFDGTTNTAGFCTIRESGNVSTVADNGTGDYTINFTTAMPDENYSVVSVGSRQFAATVAALNAIAWLVPNGATTTSVGVTCTGTNSGFSSTANLQDYPNFNVAIFR